MFGAIPGICLAVVIAVIEFLWDGWRPHYAILGRVEGLRGYHDMKRYPHAQRIPGLLLFRWDAPLFFANAELFQERLLEAVAESPTPVRSVVVAAEPVTSVDVTSADMLRELIAILSERGIGLHFAEMKDPVRDKLIRFELTAIFPGEQFSSHHRQRGRRLPRRRAPGSGARCLRFVEACRERRPADLPETCFADFLRVCLQSPIPPCHVAPRGDSCDRLDRAALARAVAPFEHATDFRARIDGPFRQLHALRHADARAPSHTVSGSGAHSRSRLRARPSIRRQPSLLSSPSSHVFDATRAAASRPPRDDARHGVAAPSGRHQVSLRSGTTCTMSVRFFQNMLWMRG